MPHDAKLTHAQSVRAEAMRLAIECGTRFEDASFADLKALAEKIEQWLYDAKAPAILRAGAEHLGNGLPANGKDYRFDHA